MLVTGQNATPVFTLFFSLIHVTSMVVHNTVVTSYRTNVTITEACKLFRRNSELSIVIKKICVLKTCCCNIVMVINISKVLAIYLKDSIFDLVESYLCIRNFVLCQ